MEKIGKYALISPVRNESKTVLCMLASVLAQSVRPLRHVIVDDGSSDQTGKIVENLSKKYDFIRLVRCEDRGERSVGAGVVKVFLRGLEELSEIPWEYIGKLDGDIVLPCRYYETLLDAFALDAKLGIVSGQCMAPRRGTYYLEPNVSSHTRGPCKIYRRACFEQIGGLQPILGWDGLDGYQARHLGWSTKTLKDLHVLHLTPTHSKEGWFRGAYKAGRGGYLQHYDPIYMLCRVVHNISKYPYIIRGLGLGLGYAASHFKKEKRFHDPGLTEYIRSEQRDRLKNVIREMLSR